MKVGELILLFTAAAVAFSGGGGSGDADDGTPLAQTCDAIGLCTIPDTTNGIAFAPRWHDTNGGARALPGVPAGDGRRLDELRARFDRAAHSHRHTQADYRQGGARHGQHKPRIGCKDIGLLMYAVREGDAAERKVGSWEVPVEVPSKDFWVPPDAGCAERALMHSRNAKECVDIFTFRAPAAGRNETIYPRARQAWRHERRRLLLAWYGPRPRRWRHRRRLSAHRGATAAERGARVAPCRHGRDMQCRVRPVRHARATTASPRRTASSLHSAIANDQMCRLPLLADV